MEILKIRKLTEADYALLSAWMKADKFHAEHSPEIFYKQDTESLVFEDELGPILFVNLARVLRAYVQFAPDQPERTRPALTEAFVFVRDRARVGGVTEIIFESVSRGLIWFCKKFLGFKPSPNEYKAVV